jgi:hypothetical protein
MTEVILEDQDEFFMSMAVFSAFIDKGMRASREFEQLASNGWREREIVDGAARLVPYAVQLERAILASDVPGIRSDSMVELDVCEPFGRWYVEHFAERGAPPYHQFCRDHLANMLIAHFSEGKSPSHAWAILCAVKAQAPALRLDQTAVKESMNWEWAPRLVVTTEIRARDEHPLHPRSDWRPQAGPAHISQYWPWVQHRIQDAFVRSRYESLATKPDIFMQLVMAKQAYVDQHRVRNLDVRRDLAAQETIEALPARTTFAAGLFTMLPGLYRAFCELDPEFDLQAWIGLPVARFMSAHTRGADPELTPIFFCTVGQEGAERPYTCTLAALWEANLQSPGVWRLGDGTTLTLNVESAVHRADEAGGEFEAA